jgi:hypothetical protein
MLEAHSLNYEAETAKSITTIKKIRAFLLGAVLDQIKVIYTALSRQHFSCLSAIHSLHCRS